MKYFAKVDGDSNVLSIKLSLFQSLHDVEISKELYDKISQNKLPRKYNLKLNLWVDFVDNFALFTSAKEKRYSLLLNCDWTQLPDVPEETRLKWQDYRQALRDITLQEGFPENIIWPTKPE